VAKRVKLKTELNLFEKTGYRGLLGTGILQIYNRRNLLIALHYHVPVM